KSGLQSGVRPHGSAYRAVPAHDGTRAAGTQRAAAPDAAPAAANSATAARPARRHDAAGARLRRNGAAPGPSLRAAIAVPAAGAVSAACSGSGPAAGTQKPAPSHVAGLLARLCLGIYRPDRDLLRRPDADHAGADGD